MPPTQQNWSDCAEWKRNSKLRKRDLLHSDTEGNRIYAIDLASYAEALAKATRGEERCARKREVQLVSLGWGRTQPQAV